MVVKRLATAIIAAGILICAGLSCRAEEKYFAAVIRELPQATVSLDQALKASDREGSPISAEYDVQDGDLQISVYAQSGDQFSEVIVDPRSGMVIKTKPLTDPREINEAREQSAALAKAKLPLEAALETAVSANRGYRAISVIPMLGENESVAAITLIKGEDIKTVAESLE